jgi:hypothetical protein
MADNTIAQLNAATTAYYLPLINNIYEDEPTIKKFMARTRKVGGGSTIKVPIINSQATSGGAYGKTDTLTIVPHPVLTENHFHWAHYWSGNELNKIDIMENSDKAQIVNLLTVTMEGVKNYMQDKLATDIWTAGVTAGATNSGKVTSVPEYLDYTNYAIIGDVDRSDPSGYFYKSNLTATAGSLTYDLMATKMNQCKRLGLKFPDYIVTTQALWEKYWSMTFNKVGMMNSQQAISDTAVKFWGADLMWSDKVATGEMYFLNTDHMFLVVHPKDNLQWSGWVDMEPTLRTKTIQGSVGITLQLICDFPMSCGLLQGLS